MTHRTGGRKVKLMLLVCAVLSGGCKTAPVQRFEPIESYDLDRVERAASASRELIAAGLPLTAKQEAALLPPAEHAMKVPELPKFLAGQAGFDERIIGATMAQVHGDFLRGKEGKESAPQSQPADDNWPSDEAFLSCTIWLYHWQTPSKLTPRGLLLAHEEGLGLSSYFLVRDGVVVQAGYIARRGK